MVGIYILKKKKKKDPVYPTTKPTQGSIHLTVSLHRQAGTVVCSPAPKDLTQKIHQSPTSDAKLFSFFFSPKVKFLLSDLLGFLSNVFTGEKHNHRLSRQNINNEFPPDAGLSNAVGVNTPHFSPKHLLK